MKIQIQTACADGAETDWFKFGSGSRTMVILPGLSLLSVCENADAVASAYSVFAEEYTVYLIDRRKKLPSVYSVEDMARDTAAVFDELGIRGAYVLAISQGGMIAQLIAAQRPELVSALVLGSTAASISGSHRAQIMSWVDAAEHGDAHNMVMGFAGAVYSEQYFRKNRKAFETLAKILTREQLDRFVILAGSSESFDIRDRTGGITCPTLVIGGGKDMILGAESSREIAGRLGCELYIYENGCHASYDEESDYKDRVMGFFEKCRNNC